MQIRHYLKQLEEKELHGSQVSNPGEKPSLSPFLHLNTPCRCHAADPPAPRMFAGHWPESRGMKAKFDGGHTYLFLFMKIHDHWDREIKIASQPLNLDDVHTPGQQHSDGWVCDFTHEGLPVHGSVSFRGWGRQWVGDLLFCLRSHRLLAADPSVQACSLLESCQASH